MQKRLLKLLAAIILSAGFVCAVGGPVPQAGATPPTPPDDPIPSLIATYDSGSNSVALQWAVPTEFDPEITGFHISWSLRGQNNWSSDLTLTNINATTATVNAGNGLLPHRYYEFRISAFNLSGDGGKTRSDPVLFGPHVYNITTCDELQDIDSDLMGDYTLANNIDCSETDDWTNGFSPISGTAFFTNAFQGTFDGKGHTITNLYSSRTGNDDGVSGVFGTLAGAAVVKNLTLAGCQIYGNSYTGALAGLVFGAVTISDVSTECLVSGTNITIPPEPVVGVGGLVGAIAGIDENDIATITRVHTDGVVAAGYDGDGTFNFGGGIVGMMADASAITDSYNSATVIGADEGDVALGGIAGAGFTFNLGPRLLIKNTYSIGGMIAVDGNVAGGIIGFGSVTDLENNFSASHMSETGDVTGGAVMGYAGSDGSGMIWLNNYADSTASGVEKCVGSFFDPQNRCTQVNTTDSPDTTYFFGNSSNEPLDNWDFDHVWLVQESGYPLLDYRPAPPESGGSGGHSSGGTKQETEEKTQDSSSDQTPTPTPKPVVITLNNYDDYLDGSGHTLSSLTVGEVIHFDVTVNGTVEHHTLTVKVVGNDYVIVTIASTPFDVKLYLDEPADIAIVGQKVMTVQLLGIDGSSADLKLAKFFAADKTQAPKAAQPSADNTSLIGLIAVLAILLLGTGAILFGKRRKTPEFD